MVLWLTIAKITALKGPLATLGNISSFGVFCGIGVIFFLNLPKSLKTLWSNSWKSKILKSNKMLKQLIMLFIITIFTSCNHLFDETSADLNKSCSSITLLTSEIYENSNFEYNKNRAEIMEYFNVQSNMASKLSSALHTIQDETTYTENAKSLFEISKIVSSLIEHRRNTRTYQLSLSVSKDNYYEYKLKWTTSGSRFYRRWANDNIYDIRENRDSFRSEFSKLKNDEKRLISELKKYNNLAELNGLKCEFDISLFETLFRKDKLKLDALFIKNDPSFEVEYIY